MSYEETIQGIPADPEQAWNFEALLALWEEQRGRTEISTEQLEAWSQRVLDLLRLQERQLFLDETILTSGIFGMVGSRLSTRAASLWRSSSTALRVRPTF